MRPLALTGTRAAVAAAWVSLPLAYGGADAATACRPGSRAMARVELFFGAAHVGPKAWTRFLASVVTPRFPDGLTSLDATGQWRGPAGLVREPSRVLVILYDPDASSDTRIEAIRRIYMARYRQTSVLRVDSAGCVSF